jgi:protease-4
MSLDADLIVDRRRMRRKLTFWRVAAVLVAAIAVVAGAVVLTGNRAVLTGGPGGSIARVTIEGLIRANRQRVEALDRLAGSNAKAVIVHVNSPGGTVAGSEELYDSLTRVRAKKPVVTASPPPAAISPRSPPTGSWLRKPPWSDRSG